MQFSNGPQAAALRNSESASEIVAAAFNRSAALRPASGPSPPRIPEPRLEFNPRQGHTIHLVGENSDVPGITNGTIEIGVGHDNVVALMLGLRFHVLGEPPSRWYEVRYSWFRGGYDSPPIEPNLWPVAPEAAKQARIVLINQGTGEILTARQVILPENVASRLNRLVDHQTCVNNTPAVKQNIDRFASKRWTELSQTIVGFAID